MTLEVERDRLASVLDEIPSARQRLSAAHRSAAFAARTGQRATIDHHGRLISPARGGGQGRGRTADLPIFRTPVLCPSSVGSVCDLRRSVVAATGGRRERRRMSGNGDGSVIFSSVAERAGTGDMGARSSVGSWRRCWWSQSWCVCAPLPRDRYGARDMPRAPRVTGRDIVRALGRCGWVVVVQRGSHAQLKHPDRGGRVTVPLHAGETLGPKLLRAILHQAGLTMDEFLSVL